MNTIANGSYSVTATKRMLLAAEPSIDKQATLPVAI